LVWLKITSRWADFPKLTDNFTDKIRIYLYDGLIVTTYMGAKQMIAPRFTLSDLYHFLMQTNILTSFRLKKPLNLSKMTPRLNHFLLIIVFLLLSSTSCKKHSAIALIDKTELIREAQKVIDSISTAGHPVNERAAQPKTIRWDLAQLVQIGHSVGISAPIIFDNAILMKASFTGNYLFHLNYLTRLLFYKDTAGNNTILVITAFPDSSYFNDPTRPFTGIKFVEDWLGHPIQKLLYTPDGHIKRYIPTTATKQPDAIEVIETCYEITGYNYSPDLPDEPYYWSEPAGCSTAYIDDGSGDGAIGTNGSSGGGAAGAGTASVTVLPGNSVIKNIAQYFQCFTNVGGSDHTYTVSVCVDQPDPGTRTPWTTSGDGSSGSSSGNNPIDAGHTFLLLTETYGNTTITRNVGFYPLGGVSPLSTTSQGCLNDDETHIYNISGSFTVNGAQFFNILNFVSQGNTPGYLYNLNTNNCTTFVINAVAQAGINLPRTVGTWPDGAGDDPGDLGEDLRENNISGMVVNLNGGSGISHPNVGQCN
jgi:hypothetical protein